MVAVDEDDEGEGCERPEGRIPKEGPEKEEGRRVDEQEE